MEKRNKTLRQIGRPALYVVVIRVGIEERRVEAGLVKESQGGVKHFLEGQGETSC